MNRPTNVPGAARYYVAVRSDKKPAVFMAPSDGGPIIQVDSAPTMEAAEAKADRWQKRENKAVLKSQNLI